MNKDVSAGHSISIILSRNKHLLFTALYYLWHLCRGPFKNEHTVEFQKVFTISPPFVDFPLKAEDSGWEIGPCTAKSLCSCP